MLVAAGVVLISGLAACGGQPAAPLGQPGHVRGFAGMVAAEEPRAALVARDILSSGGSAGDAAVAAVLTMTVTLPSAASLAGGGVCVAFNPARNEGAVLDFMPPRGVPGVGRGMFALHAQHGRLRWEEVVIPAENLARFGGGATRALVHDAAAAPAGAAADFYRSVREGEQVANIELAAQLARLRVRGPGELHAGEPAEALLAEARAQGLAIDPGQLRAYVPRWLPPATARVDNDEAMFHPSSRLPTLVGGAAAPAGQGRDPALAGVAVVDSTGGIVACNLTMGRPFGTGAAASGMLLADLTGVAPPPVAVIANRPTKQPRLAIVAADEGAIATAIRARTGWTPAPLAQAIVPGSETNAVACREGRPNRERCDATTDPRGNGLALGVGD